MGTPMKNFWKAVLMVGLSVTSAGAYAHVGNDGTGGFVSGLLHPITGWDHMVVIVAIGILAARVRARSGWIVPIVFVVTMGVSAMLTSTGSASVWAEYGVLASVLAVGGALAFGIRGPLLVTVGMVALFAAFHGYVHGAEAAAGTRAGFLCGVILATAVMQALGYVLGRAPGLARIHRLSGATILAIALYGVT